MYNLYKCYIAVESWMTTSCEDVEYIWATSYEEAKNDYICSHGFRRNKKGLTIEQIEYHKAKKVVKKKTQIVTEKQSDYLGGYNYGVYKDVTHYYCSYCGTEVKDEKFCKCCDAELF